MTDDLLFGLKQQNTTTLFSQSPYEIPSRCYHAVIHYDEAEKVEVNLFQQDAHDNGKEILSRAPLLSAVNRMTTRYWSGQYWNQLFSSKPVVSLLSLTIRGRWLLDLELMC